VRWRRAWGCCRERPRTCHRSKREASGWAAGRTFWRSVACSTKCSRGRGSFGGDTTSDILACVIRAEPDWSSLSSAVPWRIRELLRRCLQKDPKQRLRDIGEASIAIEEVLSGVPPEAAALHAGAVGPPVWRRAVPQASGILLALVVGVGVWELHPLPEAAQIVHFSFSPREGDSLVFRFGSTPLAISRNGTEVVFLARHGGTPQLYVRRMDRLESESLAGTNNGDNPFFSPDGKWFFFCGWQMA